MFIAPDVTSAIGSTTMALKGMSHIIFRSVIVKGDLILSVDRPQRAENLTLGIKTTIGAATVINILTLIGQNVPVHPHLNGINRRLIDFLTLHRKNSLTYLKHTDRNGYAITIPFKRPEATFTFL